MLHQVRNPELKGKLEALVRRALPPMGSLAADMGIPISADPSVLSRPDFSTLARHVAFGEAVERALKGTKEFSACKAQMTTDVTIKALFGQLVGGRAVGGAVVDDPDQCIVSFVARLFRASTEYDQDIFDRQYDAFEDLFFGDTITLQEVARLFNFQCEVDSVILEQGLSIQRVSRTRNEWGELQDGFHMPYLHGAKSDFVLERVHAHPKVVGDDFGDMNDCAERTADLFDEVVKCLRVWHPSGVFRDHQIRIKVVTFHPLMDQMLMTSITSNVVIGEACVLRVDEIEEFRAAFRQQRHERNRRFRVALDRLSFAHERKSAEDRLIDAMIGLEALYLPDSRSELTLRLALRVAWTLGQTRVEREGLEQFMRKAYASRGSIAHGGTSDTAVNEAKQAEDILRRSLKLWLADKSRFEQKVLQRVVLG